MKNRLEIKAHKKHLNYLKIPAFRYCPPIIPSIQDDLRHLVIPDADVSKEEVFYFSMSINYSNILISGSRVGFELVLYQSFFLKNGLLILSDGVRI